MTLDDEKIFFLKNIRQIDEKYLKIAANSKQSELFYQLIEKNLSFANKIFTELLRYTNNKKYIDAYLNHIGEHIVDINYTEYNIINSKKKLSIAIITCAIIWSFNETSQYKHTSVNNSLPHDSYGLINEMIDFINMFKIWNTAHNKDIILNSISKKDHNANAYRIFTILLHENILKKEANYIAWLKIKKICYIAEDFTIFKIMKIHTKSLEYKKIKNNSILLGEHYSSCWELFIPNKNNNSFFELKKDDVIKIMSKEFTNIDFDHYKEIVALYFKEHKINENSVNLDYSNYLKEYKLAIKQNNLTLIATLGKKLSIYQKALELKEILNVNFDEDEKFFLPWNYDFRGRTYYLSDISFTFNKEFRWCMYKEYYHTVEDFKPRWHIYNTRIFKKLNEYVGMLNQLNIAIKTDNLHFKHALIWLLISLGEVNKTQLGKEIHISMFISEGIKIFNNSKELIHTFEYDDKLKVLTLTKLIKELCIDLNTTKIKKRLISKDAPASVFQHLVLNFGWKDENVLKMVNLQSEEVWYDIYSTLIDEWKKNKINFLSENEKQLLNFFNRKSLKKIIMTSNYGVGYDSAENYFKDIIFNIKANETEEFKSFFYTNWKQIQNFLEDFFNFVNNLLIVKNNPNEIIKYVSENGGFLLLSDALIDLNYYEKNKYIVDIQHDAKRYTKLFNAIGGGENQNKFKTATRANYIHSLDAALTRWVIIRHGFFTIHDCFLVDPANITYLVSLVNEGMSSKFDNYNKSGRDGGVEIFSIFVVI